MQAPFERIVQEYGLNVLRVCRALLDEHRAQDAWSETFLAALKASRTCPKMPTSRPGWCASHATRPSTSCASTSPKAWSKSIWKALWTPARGPGAQLENLQLWHEVNQLPPKQRQVIAYRYLGGLSYAGIAGIISGSEAAARRAGADGIKNLRAHLGEPELWREQP